ncbi:MAG: DUF3300 domain-containing protein, partial [Pseudomonadota bacterium]
AALCGVSEIDILSVNTSISDANQIYAGQRLNIPSAVASTILSNTELETLLAPVALYPDALLAEILPAATYPLELVQANRLVKTEGSDASTDDQDWAPSVSALVRYPEVLTKLSDDLDWTIALGDAFLAQPDDVFATIQSLRAQANNAGNLKTNDHHEVIVEPVTDIEYEDTVVERRTVIRIVPRYVDRIYVPYYDPYRVYRPWAHHHSFHDPIFSFSIGYGLGSWLSHHLDWGYHHHLRVYPRHYRYPRYYGSHYRYSNRHSWSYWHHRPVHRRGYRYNAPPRVRIEQGQRQLVNVPRRRSHQGQSDRDYRAGERFSARGGTRRKPESRQANRRNSTRANNERDTMLARLRQTESRGTRTASQPRSTQTNARDRVRRLNSNSARNRSLDRHDADTVRGGLARARTNTANRNANSGSTRQGTRTRNPATSNNTNRAGSSEPRVRPRAQQPSSREARPRPQPRARQRDSSRETRTRARKQSNRQAERSNSRQREESRARESRSESSRSRRSDSGSSRRTRDRR